MKTSFRKHCESLGIDLMREDVVYIKKALSQLKQYNSRQILERYVEEWCNTMRLEKNELKKMNAGRKQANMFLTNLLIKH